MECPWDANSSTTAIRSASATPNSSSNPRRRSACHREAASQRRSSKSMLTTLRLEQPAAHPTFGAEVGRMARDLAALFRISNAINSIRDAELLQRELLRLISEVVPADHGAVLLQTDLDEETNSICTWSVNRTRRKRSRSNESSFTAQYGKDPPSLPTMRQPRATHPTFSVCRSWPSKEPSASSISRHSILLAVSRRPHSLPRLSLQNRSGHSRKHTRSRCAALRKPALETGAQPSQNLAAKAGKSVSGGVHLPRRAERFHRADPRRERHRQRSRRTLNPSKQPRQERPFVAINCAAIPEHCSKANSSATRRAHTPAPSG